MLTMSVTHPAVALMSPAPTLAPGPAHVLDFCHGAPRAMGPGAPRGEGAGKQSKLDWGPLDGPA